MMTGRFPLLVVVAIAAYNAQAQLVYLDEWQDQGSIAAENIVRMSNGDLMVVGTRWLPGQPQAHFLLWRFDENGDSLWSRSHPGSAYDHTPRKEMLALPGDRLFVASWTGSAMLQGNGDTLFTSAVAQDACETTEGRVMLVHRTADAMGTRLIDTLGNVLEDHQIGLPPQGDGTIHIARIGNGHYITLTDRTYEECFLSNRGMLMTELDTAGQLLDSLSLHTACNELMAISWCGDLISLSDGGYAGVGMHGTCRTLLVRGDANGDTLWMRYYSGFDPVLGFNCFDAYRCTELPNGHLLLSGGGAVALDGFAQAMFLETEADGEPICATSFTIDPALFTHIGDVALLPDGDVAFCGAELAANTDDVRLILGRAVDPCSISNPVVEHHYPLASLYPNPADGPLMLGHLDRMCWPVLYEVINAAGSALRTGTLQRDEPMNTQGLAAGTYHLRLVDDHGSRMTARFIVQ